MDRKEHDVDRSARAKYSSCHFAQGARASPQNIKLARTKRLKGAGWPPPRAAVAPYKQVGVAMRLLRRRR
eukprot:6193934-Pleurochrysis_carterae.AAC.5